MPGCMTSSIKSNEERETWLDLTKTKIHQEIEKFSHKEISKLIQSPQFSEFLWKYESKINEKNTIEEEKSILFELMLKKANITRIQHLAQKKQKGEELEEKKLVIAASCKTFKAENLLKNIYNLFFKENKNINNDNNNITILDQMLLEKQNLMLLTKSNASTEATIQGKNLRFLKYNSKLFSSQFQTKLQQQLQTRRKEKARISLTTQISNAEKTLKQEREIITLPLLTLTTQKQADNTKPTEINRSNHKDNNNDNNNIERNINTNDEFYKQKYINIKDNNTINENNNNNINESNDNNNNDNHNNNIKQSKK